MTGSCSPSRNLQWELENHAAEFCLVSPRVVAAKLLKYLHITDWSYKCHFVSIVGEEKKVSASAFVCLVQMFQVFVSVLSRFNFSKLTAGSSLFWTHENPWPLKDRCCYLLLPWVHHITALAANQMYYITQPAIASMYAYCKSTLVSLRVVIFVCAQRMFPTWIAVTGTASI